MSKTFDGTHCPLCGRALLPGKVVRKCPNGHGYEVQPEQTPPYREQFLVTADNGDALSYVKGVRRYA